VVHGADKNLGAAGSPVVPVIAVVSSLSAGAGLVLLPVLTALATLCRVASEIAPATPRLPATGRIMRLIHSIVHLGTCEFVVACAGSCSREKPFCCFCNLFLICGLDGLMPADLFSCEIFFLLSALSFRAGFPAQNARPLKTL